MLAKATRPQDDPDQAAPELESKDSDSVDDIKSPGVRRIEAIVSTFTTFDRILLYTGLILGGYARGLTGLMTPATQGAAVSEFNAAGQTALLSVVRSAFASASQPVWAKVMDYLGRPFVLYCSIVWYCVGYIVLANARNLAGMAVGLAIQIMGFGAQNIFLFVLVADTTSLRWRTLFAMIPSLHSIINVWASSVIADKLLKSGGWRWSYGFCAMVFPVLVIPLVYVLVLTTWKAKRRNLLTGIPGASELLRRRSFWIDLFWGVDAVGLLLLTAAIAMCLIPLTLGGGTTAKWRSANVLAPLIVGLVVIIPAFVFWEWKGARHPVVPFRLLKNRHILVSILLALTVTLTGAAQSTYLYFTLIVAFGKSVEVANRVSKLSTFAQALAGIGLGFVLPWVRRPKPFAIAGCVLYLVSYGILYRYRGGHTQAEFAGLVGGEVLIGIAGGVTQNALQTGLQAVVKHEHVGIISALFFAFYQIGYGIGSAITGALWTTRMPVYLERDLLAAGIANATTEAKAVYGNPLKWVIANPVGTPAREAVDASYRDIQRLLCIVGIAFSAVLVVESLLLSNPLLTDKRSIDDTEDWSFQRSEKADDTEVDEADRNANAQRIGDKKTAVVN